jgi:CRP-like cAMP-binding protein
VGTLAQLLAAAREVHAAPGELLVAPGVRPDGMLIIRSGTATKQSAAGDEDGAPPQEAAPAGAVRNGNRAQQHRKRQVGPGTVLNWRQLLMAAEARSVVVAVEPMELWSIPADAVRAVACAQPALLVAVARGLDEEVRRMQEAAKVRWGARPRVQARRLQPACMDAWMCLR